MAPDPAQPPASNPKPTPAKGTPKLLARQSLIYAGGNLVQAALAVGLIPLYTRLLSTEEYGAYSFVLASVQLGFSVGLTWVLTAIVRLLQRYPDQSHILSAFMTIFTVTSGLVILGGAVAFFFLENSFHRQLLILGVLYFIAMSWMEMNLRVFSARLQAGRQARSRIARSFLQSGIGASLASLGFGAQGILTGLVIGSFGPGVVAGAKEWKGVRPFRSHGALQEVLRFGLPLSVSFGIGAVVLHLDRYMVVALEGIAMLGIYALAVELVMRITNVILNPIAAAALPLAVRDLEKNGPGAARAQLRDNFILLALIAVPAAVGLISVTPDFAIVMVGPDFRDGVIAILPFVAAAFFVNGFRKFYFDYAIHLGMKTARFIWINCINLVLIVVLNYLFLKQYGIIGAAYASLLVQINGLILSIILGHSAFALPFPVFQFLRILLAAAGMAYAVSLVPGEPGFITLVQKVMVGGAVYGVLVLMLDVWHAQRRVAGILFRWRKRPAPADDTL